MKKKYLLLIDDDPDEFDFLLDASNRIPGFFDCAHAIDAKAAFAMMENRKPGLIFIDMDMPMINGLECIAIVKAKNLAPDVPMFIYSTSSDPVLKAKAKECGAADCFKKSPDSAVLAQILRKLYFSDERVAPK